MNGGGGGVDGAVGPTSVGGAPLSGGSSSGSLASGGSIASTGLQFYAGLLKAQGDKTRAAGEAAGDTYQAERLDVAAQYGDVKATQTSANMTRNLNTVLGNIDAVRAASNSDPSSPTGAAFRDNQEAIGNSQRGVAVGNIVAQTDQERSDAAYYRTASANALTAGDQAATADTISAIATAASSVGKMGMS